MRFFNRKKELTLLRKVKQKSAISSKMTFIVGKRRVGKTTLIKKAYADSDFLYLFVSQKSEILLCEEFKDVIEQALQLKIHRDFFKFVKLFEPFYPIHAEGNL